MVNNFININKTDYRRYPQNIERIFKTAISIETFKILSLYECPLFNTQIEHSKVTVYKQTLGGRVVL
jgi:hypothetical protein